MNRLKLSAKNVTEINCESHLNPPVRFDVKFHYETTSVVDFGDNVLETLQKNVPDSTAKTLKSVNSYVEKVDTSIESLNSKLFICIQRYATMYNK